MAKFGTVFCDHIAITHYKEGAWQGAAIEPLAPLPMHPASHVLHYASTCFEGFKAYRWEDGKARIFRLHDHIARMQKSAASLCLPVPDAEMLENMVLDIVAKNIDDIPAPPSLPRPVATMQARLALRWQPKPSTVSTRCCSAPMGTYRKPVPPTFS
jgi:branched-chain amino acid aminotransferase